MSGHYATLLRGTVERLLPTHEVYITDWRDARMVPLKDGTFDLDDYVDTLIDWLTKIGPGAHMLAVCQPSVPAYAATALMNADKHPATPQQPDHDGRPDRHPRGADGGEYAGDRAAPRLVPAECRLHCARPCFRAAGARSIRAFSSSPVS